MKVLLLEDDLNRVEQFNKRIKELNERNTHKVPSEIVWTNTAEKCISELKKITDPKDRFDLVLLDHDLGGEVYVDVNNKNTGSEVARWISENKDIIYNAFVITHSFNPVGAKNIVDLLPGTPHIPLLWNKEIFHKSIKIN